MLCDQDGISWVQDGTQPMTSSHSSDKRGPQARQRDTHKDGEKKRETILKKIAFQRNTSQSNRAGIRTGAVWEQNRESQSPG